ncbi:unnamed protein product [Mytilus coruscus]|uniref:Uncharacterized protein n=1 Tax=Mytilus coruscus TaxID=42192 RepID=A0A6J8F1S8_MYTCO|nr:unnamed protein product [Mytilus coruscus]
MEKLRAPERFNLDAHDLADAWKKWKEELNLYIDLSVREAVRSTLQLTMAFNQEPQNRTLEMVLQAFDGYCNPKRNETVERYRFNMRNQNREETFDKYVTELKILATTCNYGALQESLIRDKIICGIQDSHLRERLLRVIDLDLPKCLQISRAAELSKERIKTLENPTFSDLEVHGVKHKQRNPNYQQQKQHTHKTKPSYAQTSSACKYCGRKHEFNKAKCPAFGKECKRRHPGHRVRAISEESDESNDYFEINTVTLTNVNSVKEKHSRHIYASMKIIGKNEKSKLTRFQLDRGATCNIITARTLKKLDINQLQKTSQILTMYNNTTIKPIGKCILKLVNPKNNDKFKAEFVVVKDGTLTPLLGSKAVQAMNLTNFGYALIRKHLNQQLKRSHYPLPTIDDLLPELSRAKVFSVVDAKNGFWHVELDEESSLLTTFNTPFGRYRWLRMPFGLSSAPEEYQRSIVDDILIYGEGDTEEKAIDDHDRKFRALMERCRERNLKLNKEKLKLKLKEVRFIGHLVTSEGLKPDPEKIRAVMDMPKPTDFSGIRRIIGFVTYLSKFLPKLSDICEPLRKLTLKDSEFCWIENHDKALEEIKRLVTAEPVLRYYDPKLQLTVQSDASQTGLGAAVMQEDRPVAYAIRALTDTETRYAQIEKELLLVIFGLEKFHSYTYGRTVNVISDHKPLESIMKKPLHAAPKRLQRMLLRLRKYDIILQYRPGKEMYLADTLSRAYLKETSDTSITTDETESINMIDELPISEERISELQEHTKNDLQMQELKEVIQEGWPINKWNVPSSASIYFDIRDKLTLQNGLLFKGERELLFLNL